MIALLLSSALCVANTDVCAPPNSTANATMPEMGGQITITPGAVMTALGAQFQAGVGLIVTVGRWSSSDGTRGSIVTVEGALAHETVISGVRVAGLVRVAQRQGTTRDPVHLVGAKDIKGGQLQIANGVVDVGLGTSLDGHLGIEGLSVIVTSQKPIHAFKLDFDAGSVQIADRAPDLEITGTLSRPQEIAGVLVQGEVVGTINRGFFRQATLARATKLELLGLPAGEAPAGTRVLAIPSSTRINSTSSVTVCGVALLPGPAQGGPALTFDRMPNEITVHGTLAAASDIDVGGLAHVSGAVALRYTASGCKLLGLDGMLTRPSEILGLHYAAGAIVTDDRNGVITVTAKLARPEIVDGTEVKGTLTINATSDHALHVVDGTLTKAGRFEAWQVPAGTHVQHYGVTWSFTVPPGQHAHAVADHLGERVDNVIEAHFDNETSFTLSSPHTLKGTTINVTGLSIDHTDHCIRGEIGSAQHVGIFTFPKGGTAITCAGTIVGATGDWAVPTLQVGQWFATEAMAGDKATPPFEADPDERRSTPPPAPPPIPKTVTGYWVQVYSLCQGPSGIPQPPPPRKWIWLDLKGQATSNDDRNALTTYAAKRGTACRQVPCCVP